MLSGFEAKMMAEHFFGMVCRAAIQNPECFTFLSCGD
jgi:hypothetical protein